MANISPEWRSAKFSLPSTAFYGSGVKSTNSLTSRVDRTVFTQSTSRTIVEETFLKQFGPVKRRNSLLLEKKKITHTPRKRSLSVSKNKDETIVKKRRSISKPAKIIKEEEIKNEDVTIKKDEKRERSTSPDWINARFSLPASSRSPKSPRSASISPKKLQKPRTPQTPQSPKNAPKSPKNRSVRSDSPDWNTSRFSLPATTKTPIQPSKQIQKRFSIVSPRITTPLRHQKKFKANINKNVTYRISQKTLDKLLPTPEIHLFDVVKYGPAPQHKDDFLFGLNLMRSEVLNKIDLLHYKKKLRNTGMNFIRTFQQNRKTRSKRRKSNSIEEVAKQPEEEPQQSIETIEIPDQSDDGPGTPEEIFVLAPEEMDVTDAPEEIIQIEDEPVSEDTILEEAIQDLADSEETTEKSNVIETNIDTSNINGESVKISETNTFNHIELNKSTAHRNSLDSKTKLLPNASNIKAKRNSLPDIKNIKDIKKNGIAKKKPSSNRKKNIIKIKWPIARKSLLDLRKDS